MTPAHRRRIEDLVASHRALAARPNRIDRTWQAGIFDRWENPVFTADHVPPSWRFDFNQERNPFLLERLGINATFNAGAIKWNGKYCMMVRIEGWDRKSFFALAESDTGVDGFRLIDKPIVIPETDKPDTNTYDMRLVPHEDGWIYGIFCTERRHPDAEPGDFSAAEAKCGLARSKDLLTWERLADLDSGSGQQRNVVLHPEFIDGKYALYTRPQDGFMDTGSGGGIGFTLIDDITQARITRAEAIIDARAYHTIKESKNGAGAPPIKTNAGWLHIAHGVRGCAAGLRYVIYAFLCDPNDPSKAIAQPGGHLLAPRGRERIGDVSNVLFINGLIVDDDGKVFLYYASSDTRLHVATTSVDKLLDYVQNTPPDGLRTAACVQQRRTLIDGNQAIMDELGVDWR